MPVPPLYVCPDCEPGPYFYAGKIIAKRCSSCENARRDAKTGFDRARTGLDRMKAILSLRAANKVIAGLKNRVHQRLPIL